MNVTVADCLKLPTLREAQLIAGDKGLERAVPSVSVLEWPETNLLSDDVLIGNELIISALVPIKDDVALQCDILRHLRSMGAAGRILGVFISKINDALIAMPFGRMDFRYSDVITDVVEYIHSRRMQSNYYTAELVNSIALLYLHKNTVHYRLNKIRTVLKCDLVQMSATLAVYKAAAVYRILTGI